MRQIRTISQKLLIGIGVLTAISLTVNLIVTMYIGRNIIKNMTDESLNIVTNQVYTLIESSIDVSIKNYLRGIAEKSKDIIAYNYEKYKTNKISYDELNSYINELLLSQRIGKTGYFYVLNSKGILTIHPKAALVGTDVNSFEFIKDQIVKKTGYLEYMWKNPNETEERKKALYMTYFEPLDMIISVSSYRDEFEDLINIGDLRDEILSIKLGESSYAYLIDYNGKMIIHPFLESQNVINQTDDDGNHIIKQIIDKKNGTIEYNWKNPNDERARRKIAILRNFERMEWIVVASGYTDEFHEPLNKLTNFLIISSILILIFMLGLVYWFSKMIAKPIKTLANKAVMISKGDLSVDINIKSNDEFEILGNSINQMKNTIVSIVDEINLLSEKAINGQLEHRGNTEKYSGDYKLLIMGLNKTLDSIISPLMWTADNIDKISKGQIPAPLDIELKGDFNIIKNNLNQCILSINQLVNDSKALFDSAIEGHLEFRADIEKHNGEYRAIIQGVNSTLDRLVGLIDNMPIAVQIVNRENKIIYRNKYNY